MLMIVPGLVTSLAGLLLLLPPSRSALRPLAVGLPGAPWRIGRASSPPAGDYIDGEVIDVHDDPAGDLPALRSRPD